MSFSDYWVKLTHKNPKLKSADKITLSRESFRKELCKAFKAGKAAGSPPQHSPDFPAFHKMFGG